MNFSLNKLDYRGCILDIDDTLYDYKSAHKIAIRYVYERFSELQKLYGFETFYKIYRAHRKKITEQHNGSGASRSRALAFLGLFESEQIPFAYGLSLDAEKIYWESLISNMKAKKEVLQLVYDLHTIGVSICVVTDMQFGIQVQKLRQLNLEKIVDFVVSSEETGCEKPDPLIFELALKKLNLKPFEVLMIGDSWEKDIKGAKKLGIDACWVVGKKIKCFKY